MQVKNHIDDRAFRNAMGQFATGITVITTELNGEVHGMTANAFMSVSLDPKLVLISVGEKAQMHQKIRESGAYAVNILSEEQKEMSMHFAGQKQGEVNFETFNHMPVLKDSLVTLTCNVVSTNKAGDHILFIGEVTDLKVMEGQSPILYYGGKYERLS